MDEKRGISLRKKRTVKPKISAPKQISAPIPQGTNSGSEARVGRPGAGVGTARPPAAPRERTPQNDKTADLVKRRYSTRFIQPPQDFSAGAPAVPGLPTIPAQYRNQPSPLRDTGERRGGDGSGIKVDIKALRDPKLRPDEYVAAVLADASEEDIVNYQQELQKIKNRTSTDLQHNVYQNRTQFIKISKEAEKLKGEMRTLRNLMTELTTTLNQTTSSNSTNGDAVLSRKASNRSSVANLEALWNTHLQTLWKRVEGSQKYLPAIPGRHIVYESGRWVELNAATWKARRRVHLILLNDHLLVASEKKRADAPQQSRDPKEKQSQNQVQLVAQRCWPLQDVQMADISTKSTGADGKGSSNAVNVRVGSESFTFATGSTEANEKATLLTAFRKAVEELRKTLEAETEERAKARDSVNYLAIRDGSLLKRPGLLGSLSGSHGRSSFMIDVDGKQQSIRWVESQIDELDIDIALQRFEDAVAKVERLRRLAKGIKGNQVAQDIISLKIDERAAKLAGHVTKELVQTHAWNTATRQNVDWLSRLGYEDRAREAYLEARSSVIKTRTRQCLFDGDLVQYIFQISFIYFTIIRNTVLIYQNCFPPVMMSACVSWAKKHVDDFNVLLTRQLSTIHSSTETWKDCVGCAQQHAAMLADVGLDFKYLIEVPTGEEEEEEEEAAEG
ncbi:hypothetical protein NA57DRAFT_53042 [Rhizodiscina lignyota]|uniref:Exocyst complex component EXO84 n=1 Tax=Rhizodiscina lignyota TaxID=1504668 RepID=A0A9P4IQJ3_9PEZI|nr:hypothetical protein NA57DRAFT_53042 [Rhizodiscina lignyota]